MICIRNVGIAGFIAMLSSSSQETKRAAIHDAKSQTPEKECAAPRQPGGAFERIAREKAKAC